MPHPRTTATARADAIAPGIAFAAGLARVSDPTANTEAQLEVRTFAHLARVYPAGSRH